MSTLREQTGGEELANSLTHGLGVVLTLVVAGGLFYTAGVVFYVRDERYRYHHAVWHVFVLARSIAHFCAILWYALPE